MALDDDIRLMQQISLFEGLSAEHLRLLAFGSERLRIAGGEELYQEGDPADCAYIVTLGRMNLMHKRSNGRVLVSSAEKGAILGELALISETERMTDAVAERETDLMQLNRDTFRRILVEYPDLAATLHAKIRDNLNAMIQRIEELSPHFEN